MSKKQLSHTCCYVLCTNREKQIAEIYDIGNVRFEKVNELELSIPLYDNIERADRDQR